MELVVLVWLVVFGCVDFSCILYLVHEETMCVCIAFDCVCLCVLYLFFFFLCNFSVRINTLQHLHNNDYVQIPHNMCTFVYTI